MKRKIALGILIVFLLVFGLQYQQIAEATRNVIYKSPCDAPKEYKIGVIDNRFGINRDAFSVAIKEAEAIWDTAHGKKLFVENPNAAFTISLLYDERQSLNTEINEQNDALKEKDKSLKPEIAEYERKAADLQRRVDQFNQEVAALNQQAEITEEQYNQLKAREEQLRQETKELNALATSLSLETKEFNSQVRELDETVDEYNDKLEQRPEGGKYELDANGERIEIYIYSSHEQLVNILAHEMGHALGIDHVSDEQAIMYSKTNNAVTLKQDDLTALTHACAKRNMITLRVNQLMEIIKGPTEEYATQ